VRKLGMFLGLLGGFLVMLALLAKFYATDQLMKTPLNVDTTTRLSGEAALGSDAPMPVKVTSITRTDSEKSTDKVVVWTNSSCVVRDEGDVPDCVSADDPQDRLITASEDDFASDRITGMAVNDPKLVPASAGEKSGLVNKWPFNSEKKTYPYWDASVGEAVDAKFDGEATMDGLKVYKYKVTVDKAPIEVTDGVNGFYTTEKIITVEPLTGSIINQQEHQVRVDTEGNNFITLDIAFTDDQLKTSLKDTKANVSSLNIIRQKVPLFGLILGIPALLAGVFLATRRKDEDDDYDETDV
jgi:hypothetical protein